MRNKLLVIILFVISTALLGNSSGKNRKILKRIEMKECSSCSYKIIYENSVVKLYFDKTLVLKYINSSKFKDQENMKELINYISLDLDTLNFYDPYWAMNSNPIKYGVTNETTYGFGNENSPRDIIEKNRVLRNSENFRRIITEYLIEGEFKVFEKKQGIFIFPKAINLIWWHEHSEDKYTIHDSEGEFYELPDGTNITDRYIKMSMGDKFDLDKKNK